jgi:thymidine phosphorylase
MLKVKQLGIDTCHETVAFLSRRCPFYRAEEFVALARIEVAGKGRHIVATLNIVDDESIMFPEQLGLSTLAFRQLGLPEGAPVEIAQAAPPPSLDHIRAKIDGAELAANAYDAIAQDLAAHRYSKMEIAAFLIASARFTTAPEVLSLTRAMAAVGGRLSWPVEMVADKHCIGGIPRNRTSMIVVPIVAAHGLTIPKTSSRAITSPAGTADTMEVLARVDVGFDEMREIVAAEGGCLVWGGHVNLSPADAVLISVERPLSIDTPEQMVASILSKKLAAGATHLLLDLPIGPTAKLRDRGRFVGLRKLFEYVADQVGLEMSVMATDGSQPIGRGIGPWLEARDVMQVLERDPQAPRDLEERAVLLAGHVLEFESGIARRPRRRAGARAPAERRGARQDAEDYGGARRAARERRARRAHSRRASAARRRGHGDRLPAARAHCPAGRRAARQGRRRPHLQENQPAGPAGRAAVQDPRRLRGRFQVRLPMGGGRRRLHHRSPDMSLSLHIHGAAGTVTGSCYRLVTPRGELLVDCGMFQGPKSLRSLNYRQFPFDASAIDAVLLTHAHIDHTGLFPKLAPAGFRGTAWTTEPTRDLLRWLLPDAGAILENDVDRLNRRNSRRAEPRVAPIYTRVDAEASLGQLAVQPYSAWFEPIAGVRARLCNAGHILGSAFIELKIDAEPRPVQLIFSGDIGPREKALQPDAAAAAPCDVLLLESTYGNRTRPRLNDAQRRALLGRELSQGLKAGGNVIVPRLRRRADAGDPRRHRAAQAGWPSGVGARVTRLAAGWPRHRGLPPASLRSRPRHGRSLLRRRRLPAGRDRRAEQGHRPHPWRCDHPCRFRHVRGRPRQASPQGSPVAARLHGAVRRLPGARHAGGADSRRRSPRAHPRRGDQCEGAHPRRRRLLRPCRSRRAGAMGSARAARPRLGALVHDEPDAAGGLAEALTQAGLERRRILLPELDQPFNMAFRDGRWIVSTSPPAAPRHSPPQASAARDWHNEYAQTLLDLRAALQQATDDRTRQQLLREVRRQIQAHRLVVRTQAAV